jgi:hypothetical protein
MRTVALGRSIRTAIRFSDFVSARDGHAVYHLIPLLFLAVVVLAGLLFLWLLSRPDYSTISVPSGCFTAAAVVLLLIVVVCLVLLHFPPFVLF